MNFSIKCVVNAWQRQGNWIYSQWSFNEPYRACLKWSVLNEIMRQTYPWTVLDSCFLFYCSEEISCIANNLLKGTLSSTTQYSPEKWLSFILGLTNWKVLDRLPWSSLTFIKGCRPQWKTGDYFGVFGGFGRKLVMA